MKKILSLLAIGFAAASLFAQSFISAIPYIDSDQGGTSTAEIKYTDDNGIDVSGTVTRAYIWGQAGMFLEFDDELREAINDAKVFVLKITGDNKKYRFWLNTNDRPDGNYNGFDFVAPAKSKEFRINRASMKPEAFSNGKKLDMSKLVNLGIKTMDRPLPRYHLVLESFKIIKKDGTEVVANFDMSASKTAKGGSASKNVAPAAKNETAPEKTANAEVEVKGETAPANVEAAPKSEAAPANAEAAPKSETTLADLGLAEGASVLEIAKAKQAAGYKLDKAEKQAIEEAEVLAIIQNLEMVKIPGEKFEILKTEVTQKIYKAVMGANPSKFKDENNPVENVSLYDVICFCNKLSEKKGLTPVYSYKGTTDVTKWNYTGYALYGEITQDTSASGFRLPTRKEWDYAAEGGEEYSYSGSNKIDEVGWYWENSNEKTHVVAQKKPNGYGLYDMSGNVCEWVWDVELNFRDVYWCSFCGGSYEDYYTLSTRGYDFGGTRSSTIGFRIVRNIE